MWPDTRILDLLGIELPIIQSPMAGSVGSAMAIAVSEASGLGSLPCASLSHDEVRAEVGRIRQRTTRPINLNFFCHHPPRPDQARERAWLQRLSPYYRELGLDPLDPNEATSAASRPPFDAAMCDLVIELAPAIVSFHFGLPDPRLVDRIKAAGAKLISSATTVDEARWLADAGCDAVIAQGAEAGGHRGMFLTADVATQLGTIALVPQVADAVSVPVIAAGGIADGRGIVAAFALGASAVQLGTAYLRCPEALISPLHRQALASAATDQTALTNVFTGRPARALVNRLVREVGPISDLAPDFPLAAAAVMPLRLSAESAGSNDFSFMLCGQAAPLGVELPAGELTKRLAADALAWFSEIGGCP